MMVGIDERVGCLEKDMTVVKAEIDANLTGERSVWNALEKFMASVDEFRSVFEADRKEIREIVHLQAIESTRMSTAYEGMTVIFRILGGAVTVAVIGILIGLLTHTIHIG